ncbi:MAG TPA: hypothetical protein VMV05_09110, partial [bacterium]|nr:hypothetical protein [bacterium]
MKRHNLLFLFVLGVFAPQFIPCPAQAQCGISFDNAKGVTFSGNTITFPFTVGTTGNRLLVLQVGINSTAAGATVTSATYNGTGLSVIRRDNR